ALIALLRRRGRSLAFFAAAAAVALLLAFGSPLYVVIYRLPGLSQVHTPFRWIYIYSLAVALLAGMGADALLSASAPEAGGSRWRRLLDALALRAAPGAALAAGLGVWGALAVAMLLPERAAALGDRLVTRLALAPQAFADGRMFISYQARNLAILAGALTLSGLLLLLVRRARRRPELWAAAAALVIVGELWAIGLPFFPRTDPALVAYRTPAIAFLQRDPSLFRITTYVGGDEKTFNANAGMFYGLSDVRGYDSIIPAQYVAFMQLIQEQSELPYNRIAPILDRHAAALDSPLLDVLNVKYVLTTKERTISSAKYALVYEGEVRIYENRAALPRAFLVPRAVVVADPAERQAALRTLDPRSTVILEQAPQESVAESVPATFSLDVEDIRYAPNEVSVTFTTPITSFLVLGDSYFPGWLAFIRPADAPDAADERALPIYRANGNFRAVQVPPGRPSVRFKYSPDAGKYGFYLSCRAAALVALALALWGWVRVRRKPADEQAVQRVTRNTVAPLTMNLINKVMDMAFAMLMLRILGPADAGQFYLAVVVVGWFDILTNFGLNTLVTREVAKDRDQANRYLSNTIVLRVGLWAAAWPVLAAFVGLRRMGSPLQPTTVLAIALFTVGLLPSNISASFSALFSAHERMELPAAVTVATTLLKVTLGTVALILRGGYVGLALVSIVVNLLTLAILYALARAQLFRPRLVVDWAFQRRMTRDAYPLMINLLLATLFFKVAVLLLEWLVRDTRVLGWYSTAYKYIDAVGLIPAYFTLAIFPIVSRYAATAKESLARAYFLAIKLLLMVAVPGALIISTLSTELIAILGGSQYLPQAAGVLAVMIWYMPIGFINSVTQYVLIALDQQRFLTRAFAIGLGFNVLCNVLLIPRLGYLVAAYVAIASELALLIPFYLGIRRHLTRVPWLRLIGRQALCALPLTVLLVALPHRFALAAVVVGLAAHVAGLRWLGVFDARERQVLASALPVGRLVARLMPWRRPKVDAAGSPR
ncbi:MAG: oligosaccharide flippase family protein, partial [Chloroflexota bacterium]